MFFDEHISHMLQKYKFIETAGSLFGEIALEVAASRGTPLAGSS
jgi:hypothetical protein